MVQLAVKTPFQPFSLPAQQVALLATAFQPRPPIHDADVQFRTELHRLACLSRRNGTNERLAHTADPVRHALIRIYICQI